MANLDIISLRKRFGAVEILKGIDITLEKGGFLVLVGPSGCGKSTLLNTIAGLESISAGEIRIGGKVVNELHPSKRDIAMVFQSYALYPNMSVAENIGFGMEMRGVPKADRATAVASVAKTLQIEHLLDRRPSQLSGGQRQRVAMGRALVRKPSIFLFDEPLSNLDAKLRVDMRIEIKRLHQTTGTTIVYVTHDQIEAMTLATKIAVLKDGELQQVGTPSEIYNTPANLFVADFMGSPAMNLLEGKVTGVNGSAHILLERHDHPAIVVPIPGERGRQQTEGWRQGDFRHPPGGGQRHRKHRPQCEVDREVRRAGRDRRARRFRHVRRHPCRRQGTYRAHARRHGGSRRPATYVRAQSGQGGAVRSHVDAPPVGEPGPRRDRGA